MRRSSDYDRPQWLPRAGLVAAGASLCGVLYAAFSPIHEITPPADSYAADARRSARQDHDTAELARTIAGSSLIRPAHAVKAIRTDGAAKALLDKIRLRGVVRKGDVYMAYLSEEGKSTTCVQKGDSFLGFVVNEVAVKKVVLEFEGSLLELKH